MRDGKLRIGEVAELAGVNVQTLRYYERRAVISEPERTKAGYRLYPPETVQLIRFIKRAQELGFTLSEVEQLLALRDNRDASCEEVQALASGKMSTIDEKIRHLTGLKEALQVLVLSCERGDEDRECPLLESLENTAA